MHSLYSQELLHIYQQSMVSLSKQVRHNDNDLNDDCFLPMTLEFLHWQHFISFLCPLNFISILTLFAVLIYSFDIIVFLLRCTCYPSIFLPFFFLVSNFISLFFSYYIVVNAGKSFTLETSLPVNDGNLNALSMYNSLIGVAFDNGGKICCFLSGLILFSLISYCVSLRLHHFYTLCHYSYDLSYSYLLILTIYR